MITLPAPLEKVMQSQDLKGLKPFAMLFRNKWDSINNKFELEPNPIDISDMIAKPNTLSMTLDVSEIAQYNANNITLTLTDKDNRFVEGTPKSYFPSGYQLYGSKVILYYGLDVGNWTSLFVGVIKDLPTHKPEQYQVDLKLISPLELLNDIEAKEFSDKYIGEALTFVEVDDDGHYVYNTANTGVGGFNAVYADGNKLFEGIDYEVSQTNALGLPAIITIIKADYYSSTITADYYCWKTGLPVEQIVRGLVALGGYTSNTDIRNVIWRGGVRNQENTNLLASIGYVKSAFAYNEKSQFGNNYFSQRNYRYNRYSFFPNQCKINMKVWLRIDAAGSNRERAYAIGTRQNNLIYDGFIIQFYGPFTSGTPRFSVHIYQRQNGNQTYKGTITSRSASGDTETSLIIERNDNNVIITGEQSSISMSFNDFDFGNAEEYNELVYLEASAQPMEIRSYEISLLSDETAKVVNKGFLVESSINQTKNYTQIKGSLSDDTAIYSLNFRYKENNIFNAWQNANLNTDLGIESETMQAIVNITNGNTNIIDFSFEYISTTLVLSIINLSGRSVLEALQDLALISGYEFGVDRNGIFFFRPRSQSTTPIFDLDESEIVKIDNIKQNFSDFFTKLTLTFAQIPLEFYANTGTRPTPVDKYGIINKEIDKPDIVNYDNPELAQAIGPQLLEVYSDLSDVIQCTAKLNLSLELGDIVNLKRNYNLTCDDNANDYTKFINQNTYYRACKITGINYNLSKRQMTYTLRDVSNSNNEPFNPDIESES